MKNTLEFQVLVRDEVVAEVVVREDRTVDVKQYTNNPIEKPFPMSDPTIKDVSEFLRSRCFPEERANKKELLGALGLEHYIPLNIVRETHGVMFEDYLWIRFRGETLQYDDVKIRD